MLKDICGKEIRTGDHIIYVKSWGNKDIEEAIVTICEKEFIRVEYLGKGSPPMYYWRKKKAAGEKSTFTATEKKVIIITSDSLDDSGRNAFNKERDRLKDVIKTLNTHVEKAVKKEKSLLSKIEVLQAEVDKIHSRWNILDL